MLLESSVIRLCLHDQSLLNVFNFRIFANGVNMDVSKLYPPIDFPVSRGTPMISSLIQWDHSENHFLVTNNIMAAKSEWLFMLDINDIDYEYVCGHTIDGE